MKQLDIKCKKVVLLVFLGQIKWGQSFFSKIVLHLPYFKIIFIAWTDILKMRYGRTQWYNFGENRPYEFGGTAQDKS